MDMLTSATTDQLFEGALYRSSQLTALAAQALNSGIDKYIKKDYTAAAGEFKRAFGLAPQGDHAVDAVKYLAMSYQRLGQTEKAMEAYELGLKSLATSDELQAALGNLYFAEDRTAEAISAYEKAVRLYDDGNNRFALGQGYLKAGRYDDAARQFRKVIRSSPEKPDGYFGLGQVYAARGVYSEALAQFERAVQKDGKFYDGYLEMGYLFADSGQLNKAGEIQSDLENKDKALAGLLGDYIRKKTPPRIMCAWPTGSFPYYLQPKTRVDALSGYLANANTSQSFSVLLQFDKAMDRETVEDPSYWTIRRSGGNGPGMQYNYGLPVPATEARISPIPTSVYYDEKRSTALVRFTIHQNAAADATIDPSHLEFAFRGTDADGNPMHPEHDQYMGFSGSF